MNHLCHSSAHSMQYRHNCLVVYRRRLRDWFRKTYWVACIYCEERSGPHRTPDTARAVAIAFNQGARLPAPNPEQEEPGRHSTVTNINDACKRREEKQ